mmetsp:Transcript_54300/g.117486  ORF Transcript_54300/g.117486 Transcript_54300/m.117486 type:complete len:234 (-) Transcript_54300:154-855(-)
MCWGAWVAASARGARSSEVDLVLLGGRGRLVGTNSEEEGASCCRTSTAECLLPNLRHLHRGIGYPPDVAAHVNRHDGDIGCERHRLVAAKNFIPFALGRGAVRSHHDVYCVRHCQQLRCKGHLESVRDLCLEEGLVGHVEFLESLPEPLALTRHSEDADAHTARVNLGWDSCKALDASSPPCAAAAISKIELAKSVTSQCTQQRPSGGGRKAARRHPLPCGRCCPGCQHGCSR